MHHTTRRTLLKALSGAGALAATGFSATRAFAAAKLTPDAKSGAEAPSPPMRPNAAVAFKRDLRCALCISNSSG